MIIKKDTKEIIGDLGFKGFNDKDEIVDWIWHHQGRKTKRFCRRSSARNNKMGFLQRKNKRNYSKLFDFK
jgi:hypothetical protein